MYSMHSENIIYKVFSVYLTESNHTRIRLLMNSLNISNILQKSTTLLYIPLYRT